MKEISTWFVVNTVRSTTVVFFSPEADQFGRKTATKAGALAVNDGRSQNFFRDFVSDSMRITMVVLVLQIGKRFAGNRRKKWRCQGFCCSRTEE